MAPTPQITGISRVDPMETPKYLLTFRGRMHPGWYHSATVRPDLERLWSHSQVNGTVVEFLPKFAKYTQEGTNRYRDLLDTVFALVPHGDGRWNFRFSEVMNACVIPVVIADGITLPYSQLIDWNTASIILPESAIKHLSDLQGVIDLLPKDAKRIQVMRQQVCHLNHKYFETPSKRWAALLKSAAVHVAQRSIM
mmetsp:Transcript_30801/g.102580  ORF Transcript_30801/g.102580 Transcript_30801/m.102580 type:complete len:195 (+) Transcript_30801:614-1198(+)